MGWPLPSERNFRILFNIHPAILAGWIESGTLGSGFLTYAAEILGNCSNSKFVVPILLKLLKSDSPIVCEGAILGLEKHLKVQEVWNALDICATEHTSEACRKVAEGAISSYKYDAEEEKH
jgi:hypothetical protein